MSKINMNRNYKYKRLQDTTLQNGNISSEEFYEEDNSGQNRNIRADRKKNEIAFTTFPEYEEIIERPTKEGESLTSLSLKYRIPIPELKRINKIHRDVEFYALKTIRIPVKSNSALLDLINNELTGHKESESINIPNSGSERTLDELLNDKEAEKVFLKRDSFSEENDEEFYDAWIPPQKKSTCSGADWGMDWWIVLLLGALVIIGVPLLYLYYFYEHEG